MRDRISELVKNKPRNFSAMIKRDPEMSGWVKANSIITSDKFIEHIYSAVNQSSNICQHGNTKHISRFSQGWVGCGPANSCKCTRDSISANVSTTKLSVRDEQNSIINRKRAESMIQKFGVPYNAQRASVRDTLSAPKVSPEVHECLTDRDWLDNEYNIKRRTLSDIADELGVYYQTVGDYCRKLGFTIRQVTNYSREEVKLSALLDSMGIDHVRNNWDVLHNKELDIYIPSHKLAIEVNGIYWHSFAPNHRVPEKKDRHINKLREARSRGIDLIQFTDHGVKEKWDMVVSLIKSRLGQSEIISADQCQVKTLAADATREFLSANHFNGDCAYTLSLGLYHGEQLVTVMAVTESDTTVSIKRLAHKLGVTVDDGLSRLLAQFGTKAITAYTDEDRDTGSQYSRVGFQTLADPEPNLIWADNNQLMPPDPESWLPDYRHDLTQEENMFAAGYRRFWGSGIREWRLNQDTALSTLG